MSKKKNNRILLIILLALIAIVAALEFIGDEGSERSFDKELVNVDTLKLNTIEITGSLSKTGATLSYTGDKWIVKKGQQSFEADQELLERLIEQATQLESMRVVAIDDTKWGEYQVSDSLGTHVVMKSGDEVLADFYAGKFSFDQKTRQPRSYLRIKGSEETHLVEGMLGMLFNPDLDHYRMKRLSDIRAEDVTKVRFSGLKDKPGFLIEKSMGSWQVNGNPADSVSVENYIRNISRLRSEDFVDMNKGELSLPAASLQVEGANMSPLTIEFYTPDTSKVYVTSSAHPDGVFDADAALLDKLILGEETEQ